MVQRLLAHHGVNAGALQSAAIGMAVAMGRASLDLGSAQPQAGQRGNVVLVERI